MKIKEMCKEGVLAIATAPGKNPIRFIYMTNYENNKKKITEGIPRECVAYYEDEHKEVVRKYWNTKGAVSERGILFGETMMMMYAAGIECMIDTEIEGAKYYTSKELKRYSGYKDTVKNKDGLKLVNSSKAYGMLVSAGGNYCIYNIRKASGKWIRSGELKFKIHLDKTIQEIVTEEKVEVTSAIVLVESTSNFEKILYGSDNNTGNKIEGVEDVYDNVYLIPYSEDGRQMLELMTLPEWKYIMIRNAVGEYQDAVVSEVVCDHYDEGTGVYTFVFCAPDIKRFRYFINAAMVINDKDKFKIICFDYQKDFVMGVARGYAKIYTTPLAQYYKSNGGYK